MTLKLENRVIIDKLIEDLLVPLNMKLSEDITSYKALKTPCIVTCDFCDKKFNNRYDSIIHNASHIIIPLWLQTLYNCNLCNISTTTIEELETHHARTHRITVKPINYINVLKTETVLAEYKCTDLKNEIKYEKNSNEDGKKVEYEPIRNRLKFEEDITPNGLIRDLVTQCNVNVQLMKSTWLCPPSEYSTCSNVNNSQEEPKYNSIDYSNLIKPGIFNCKYCSKSYPNRFSLIRHETNHIRISQRKPPLCLYCDKYIAGNYQTLSSHILNRHPKIKGKKYKRFDCKRCGLQFRKYKRHARNYHVYDCLECGLEFNNLEQHASHKEISKCSDQNSIILKVCDLCFSFMKRQINGIYVLMGDTVDEFGVKGPCDNCGKKYFVLKTVKRIEEKRRPCCDNGKRLKNIQQRMKKLNLLHKF